MSGNPGSRARPKLSAEGRVGGCRRRLDAAVDGNAPHSCMLPPYRKIDPGADAGLFRRSIDKRRGPGREAEVPRASDFDKHRMPVERESLGICRRPSAKCFLGIDGTGLKIDSIVGEVFDERGANAVLDRIARKRALGRCQGLARIVLRRTKSEGARAQAEQSACEQEPVEWRAHEIFEQAMVPGRTRSRATVTRYNARLPAAFVQCLPPFSHCSRCCSRSFPILRSPRPRCRRRFHRPPLQQKRTFSSTP